MKLADQAVKRLPFQLTPYGPNSEQWDLTTICDVGSVQRYALNVNSRRRREHPIHRNGLLESGTSDDRCPLFGPIYSLGRTAVKSSTSHKHLPRCGSGFRESHQIGVSATP